MTVADLRRQHLVRHLLRLGESAVDELLAELARAHGIEADILRLEAYGQVDRRVLAALGADRIPGPPLAVVRAQHMPADRNEADVKVPERSATGKQRRAVGAPT